MTPQGAGDWWATYRRAYDEALAKQTAVEGVAVHDDLRETVVGALEEADDCAHVYGEGCCYGCLADQVIAAIAVWAAT